MSGRGRPALCAFAATLMTAAAMLPLVRSSGWIVQAAFLLAVQSGAGTLARRMSLPRLLTVASQALVTVLLLSVVFAREQALVGVVPGPDAVRRIADLLTAGADDIGEYAIPAPATDGIRLMLIGGVLVIGLAVDVLAVTFRNAAPAGLPLLAMYSVAAGLADGGAGWLWFLLAASGYLLLLLSEGRDRLARWGRVFGASTRSSGGLTAGIQASDRTTFASVRTGRRIGVLALGVALVVPAALPALDGGLLSVGHGSGDGKGGGGGTISAVNPLVSLQDDLNQPEDREVMSYRTTSGNPQDFYLRILALDEFTGDEWRASKRGLTDVPRRLPGPDGLTGSVAVSEVTSEISASSSYRQTYLPLPYPATEVDVAGRWRYEPAGRTLVGDSGQTTGGVRYEVSSLETRPSAEQLASAPDAPPEVLRQYTRVPSSLPKVVEETAAELTRGMTNDYERAVRLQNWFASDGGFAYDTSVNSGTGSAAIGRFLKDRRGFCVHFSFTMAAMARTLGIPARVAVGFAPGSPQPDGRYSVGLRDAHAWPELYFAGVGWTRFEPTPTRGSAPVYTQPETPAGDTADPARPETSASAAPSAAPSASDNCPAQMRKQGECGGSTAPGAALPTDPGTPVGTVAGIVLGALVVLVLPFLPLLWRLRVRRRRLTGSQGRAPADTAARVLAVWQEVVDSAWDHGIPPDDARTPRGTVDRIVRLGRLDESAANAAHRVADAVEQVLYAPRPMFRPGLVEDVSAIRAGLRAGTGRGTRWRAVLAPRSAVRVVWAVSERWAAYTHRRRTAGENRRLRWAARLRRPSRQQG
ncbi:transglutaminase TgpA family protein [Streptomyces sp. DT24]|uniref:transglutaminase TgpA family protein n=1 Tax=Streptomyces sp. DT24 TaxID=3416520 RepID=UPI003CE88173